MRYMLSDEEERLYNTFRPYIKRNKSGNYVPDDAPEEAKRAHARYLELGKKRLESEIHSML